MVAVVPPLEITDIYEKSQERRQSCALLIRFVSGHGGSYTLLYPLTEVPISDHHSTEEELCVVKLVLCVTFADRVGIGEGVQVGKQVEPG